ncbi:HD domain-containing protein [Lapillicoccus jejuensis]|uniref:HD/PDEase domain-containing protein n=1 Tax=Lapillicoccus jejuensis TaxID=402171 RepID=A0A542E2A7_9MICO|nr:HD domain-containing protein [Lapillicoccus jejuensis]TQJ09470.1 uncharacterized protein FB458_2582 [Lapillicoccus jejuensis]
MTGGAGAGASGWVPDDAQVEALHRRYAPSEQVLELVLTHGRVVADIAAQCAERLDEQEGPVDLSLLRATCLLHDLGTYALYSPDGRLGNHPAYPLHALIGATLLREEGVDERVAAAVRTHVLMGLSADDIRASGMLLPVRDYAPQGVVAELLCYADRFHSKRPCFNDPERFAAGLEASLPRQAALFRVAQQRFGPPDVEGLARRYGHPVV